MVVLACNSGQNLQKNELKEIYIGQKILGVDGIFKLYIHLKQDTLMYRYYDIQGHLIDLVKKFNFDSDSTSDELFYRFYENGSLAWTGKKRYHIEDSTWSYYDENGNITKRINYVDGIPYGDYYEYYRSHKIKKYSFLVNEKTHVFSIKFDSSGKLAEDDHGYPLTYLVCNKTFNLGDSVDYEYFFGVLPGWTFNFVIKENSNNYSKILCNINNVNSMKKLYFAYKYDAKSLCNRKGKFIDSVFVSSFDSLSSTEHKFQRVYSYTVK